MTLIAVTQKLTTGAAAERKLTLPMLVSTGTSRTRLDKTGPVSQGRQVRVKRAVFSVEVVGVGACTVMPCAINAAGTSRDLAAAATTVTATPAGSVTELTLYAPAVSGQTDYRISGGDWINSNLGLLPDEQLSCVITGATSVPAGSIVWELEEVDGHVDTRVNA